jgi:hypothetical protein
MRIRIMPNRIFTFIIALSLVFGYSSNSLFSEFDRTIIDADLNATDEPDHIMLTWSDDPTTTQTVSWRAKSTVTNGSVRYRETNMPNAPYMTVNAYVETFTSQQGDAPGSMNIFSARLSGLKPGTRYSYTVQCGTNASPEKSFTTAVNNIDTFEFLIFGDSQGGDAKHPHYAPWHDTVEAAYRRHPISKFIINMGDLVEVGQSYMHWNNWFDAAKDVISSVPIVPVQGNHETYTMVWRERSRPVYYTSQFKVFQNGPNGLKGQVYSFDYGTIHFSVLDSQQDEESPIRGDILSVQKEWLDRDLASSKKPWKIVLMHKPPYFSNPRSTNTEVKAAFYPVFDKYHVDLVFAAHDHIIARTFPMKNDKQYSKPKDGTVYYITGRSGSKHYDFLFSMPWHEFFYNPRTQPCYLSVRVNKNRLYVGIYNQDGSSIDCYSIVK